MQELTRFVAAQWVALTDKATGQAYFFNALIGRPQYIDPMRPPEKVRQVSLSQG